MMILGLLALVVALAIPASCRDAITVNPETSGSLTDLSGTGLIRKYCKVPGKEIDAGIIESNFAGTEFQCTTRCNQRRDCLGMHYTSDRLCQLLAERSTTLTSSSSTYFYRLKEGEKCPVGQLYSPPEITFGNTFCMLWGKTCVGTGYFKKPAKIATMTACLEKCAMIRTCTMVNYDSTTQMCEPIISAACPDETLVDAPTVQNFLRLPLGETECPDGRGPPSPTAPPPTKPQPEPTDPPTEAPEPDYGNDCGGKKYVSKVWGKRGQNTVIGSCRPGCAMTVCHCRPWGKCDGARFTSDGKCKVVLRHGMKRRSKKRVFAHIKCVPKSSVKTQYISSQTPGERLRCGTGYRLGDCTFYAHKRKGYMKTIRGQRGCGVRRHRKGCNRIGRCTSTGVCFKKN